MVILVIAIELYDNRDILRYTYINRDDNHIVQW